MDKLRRSFRSNFRRKDDYKAEGTEVVGNSNSRQWPADEAAVKTNTCNFEVKYLGCTEVFESRGMQVCEEAVKLMKHSKRRPIKGTLHISGDGLRVSDSETKGLILDQTIEKVSFCAPDRNFERGFSYICRDGTTRRWMCHGFLAIRDTGERLSHAVGCAFAICLEKKQKRDRECAVMMQYDDNENTFTRLGSFRQGSITDRLQDPQIFKPAPDTVPDSNPTESDNSNAIARPRPSDQMLRRQASFRGLGQLAGTSPFKRQSSLRLQELPSYLADRQPDKLISPISGGSVTNLACDPVVSRSVSLEQSSRRGQVFSCPAGGSVFSPISEEDCGPLSLPAAFNQCVSLAPSPQSNRSPLPTVPENKTSQLDPLSKTSQVDPLNRTSQLDPLHKTSQKDSLNSCKNFPLDSLNPWDHVPDQPNSRINQHEPISLPVDLWLNSREDITSRNLLMEEMNFSNKSTNEKVVNKGLDTPPPPKPSILDDPFDADWASLAMRNNQMATTPRSTNPFSQERTVKTFELKM